MKNNRETRYLIGNGEKLAFTTNATSGPPPPKIFPYSISEAAARLTPRLERVVNGISHLPSTALPQNRAVLMLSVHHEFIAKTYFPKKLFGYFGMSPVGSRMRSIRPEKCSKKPKKQIRDEYETVELFVSAHRDVLSDFFRNLQECELNEIRQIEDLRLVNDLNSEGRVIPPDADDATMEVALHIGDFPLHVIVDRFHEHAVSCGAKVDVDRVFEVPGLAFLPVVLRLDQVVALSDFTFLRNIRPVTKLRPISTPGLLRSEGPSYSPSFQAPVSPSLRAAIIDGGLPTGLSLPGVRMFQTMGVGDEYPGGLAHGLSVTSAFLWGAFTVGEELPRPPCSVDHYRVIGNDDIPANDVHAFDVLGRVRDVLETGSYGIVNLSLGPSIPVDDGDVHLWTSTLDYFGAEGNSLIVVAAGNNGLQPSPLCRVQVPADGVNCLAVGASDSLSPNWKRARYSAVGPGRRPGITKPDIVAFGGGDLEEFPVITYDASGINLATTRGTSFASPLVARTAAEILATFGTDIRPLTLKTLLIHTADRGQREDREVGWGGVRSLAEITECPSGVARVIYQGSLAPKKFLRARLPMPSGLEGKVTITATLCYATKVSASDPANYTNSGVEVHFRPHVDKFNIDKESGRRSSSPRTNSFFRARGYATEGESRVRHRKWETVLHESKTMLAGTLKESVFDLHFIPRLGIADDPNPDPIPYSLVISVESKRHGDIYDRILSEFPKLQALTPIQINISDIST